MRLAGGRGLKAQVLRRYIKITAKKRAQQPTANELAPAIFLQTKPLHSASLICRKALLQPVSRHGPPRESRAPDMHLVMRPWEPCGRLAPSLVTNSHAKILPPPFLRLKTMLRSNREIRRLRDENHIRPMGLQLG
jgi:hypothetical protein